MHGSITLNVELAASPDVMTHVAHIVNSVLAVDGIVTEIRRTPSLATPHPVTSGDVVAASDEQQVIDAEVEEITSPPRRRR